MKYQHTIFLVASLTPFDRPSHCIWAYHGAARYSMNAGPLIGLALPWILVRRQPQHAILQFFQQLCLIRAQFVFTQPCSDPWGFASRILADFVLSPDFGVVELYLVARCVYDTWPSFHNR